MKYLSFLFIVALIILSACNNKTTVSPTMPQDTTEHTTQVVPPIDYAKKYTSKMRNLRSWTCYNSSYGNWGPSPGGTRKDTSQMNVEVVVINDSTVFFRGDTLAFISTEVNGFGGTVYRSDTSYRLLYSINKGMRSVRMLYYYYKTDSITDYSSFTANGGGYSNICHTN